MDNLVYSPVFAIQEQMLLQWYNSNGMDAWQWAKAFNTSTETTNTNFTAEPLQNFSTAPVLRQLPHQCGVLFWTNFSEDRMEHLQLSSTYMH